MKPIKDGGGAAHMTLRDHFAAHAMHAMLNNDIRREEMATVSNMARDAYQMADAMLAERVAGDGR